MNTPTVANSSLPGLLGLNALRKNRAVIDVVTNKLYFMGPGGYNLDQAMPPGTDIIQCETAPSGHIILPCCEYDAPQTTNPRHSLSLHSRIEGGAPGLSVAEQEPSQQHSVLPNFSGISNQESSSSAGPEVRQADNDRRKRVQFSLPVTPPPPPEHPAPAVC